MSASCTAGGSTSTTWSGFRVNEVKFLWGTSPATSRQVNLAKAVRSGSLTLATPTSVTAGTTYGVYYYDVKSGVATLVRQTSVLTCS